MAEIELQHMGPTEIAKDFGTRYFQEAHSRNINVSQLLEQIDPSERYKEETDRSMDAFERLSVELGFISNPSQRSGIQASTYEDVTKTETGRAWFAEFSARTWRESAGWNAQSAMLEGLIGKRALFASTDYIPGGAGAPWADDLTMIGQQLQVAIPLASVIAGTRQIEGDAYRSVYVTDSLSSDNYRMKRVGEGTEIPATSMVTGERTIRLNKYGRAIRYTYEQMRRQRLDRIAFLIARMALLAEADKVQSALDTIVSGDGNSNTAATVYALTTLDTAATAGTLSLKGYLSLKNQFYPYIPSIVLAQEAAILQLQLLPISTGNSLPLMMTPAGGAMGSLTPINPNAWNLRYGIVAGAPALKLVTFDPAWAVEQIAEVGSTISELEKYINNQTWMLTMTETMGFATIDSTASRILNINA